MAMEKTYCTAAELMKSRFGCDRVISLATVSGNIPQVRSVNAYYENGSFYIVTHALSGKMSQLCDNPNAAICGDWFTAHGVGENLGCVKSPENAELAQKLRTVFSAWYGNGHINEDDTNTVILRIKLTDGVLFDHGTRYDIDFAML